MNNMIEGRRIELETRRETHISFDLSLFRVASLKWALSYAQVEFHKLFTNNIVDSGFVFHFVGSRWVSFTKIWFLDCSNCRFYVPSSVTVLFAQNLITPIWAGAWKASIFLPTLSLSRSCLSVAAKEMKLLTGYGNSCSLPFPSSSVSFLFFDLLFLLTLCGTFWTFASCSLAPSSSPDSIAHLSMSSSSWKFPDNRKRCLFLGLIMSAAHSSPHSGFPFPLVKATRTNNSCLVQIFSSSLQAFIGRRASCHVY